MNFFTPFYIVDNQMKIEQVIGLRRLIVVKHGNYATKSENDDMETRKQGAAIVSKALWPKGTATAVGSVYS